MTLRKKEKANELTASTVTNAKLKLVFDVEYRAAERAAPPDQFQDDSGLEKQTVKLYRGTD